MLDVTFCLRIEGEMKEGNGKLEIRRAEFLAVDEAYKATFWSIPGLSLFLIGRTVGSPYMVRTVLRTILRLLTDLLMRCKLQPELCCAGCTQTRVHMLTHDTCSLSSIRGRKPRQWMSRLCHELTYSLVFICWVPQITLTLPQVLKWGHFLRSERLKTFTLSAMYCCPSFFLFHRRALWF